MTNIQRPHLQTTLDELQKAFEDWNSLNVHPQASITKEGELPQNSQLSSETNSDVRKKTQDLLKKLTEQIKDLGL